MLNNMLQMSLKQLQKENAITTSKTSIRNTAGATDYLIGNHIADKIK